MTTYTMKMALASEDDLNVAYDLLGLIDNVERDHYPADEHDEDAPTHLDTDDIDHLRFFYNKLKAIVDRRSSGALHRVVGGFSTVRYAKNQILDLTLNVVALHPRIVAALAATHWTPVGDALPTEPGWYLVMIEPDNDWELMSDTALQVEFGAYTSMPQAFTYSDGWHDGPQDITSAVTHWMPVPAAPLRGDKS